MPSRRIHPSRLTERYEDTGLYKTDLVSVTTQVHPVTRKSSRGDFQMAASFKDGQVVQIIFPGRRATKARPLAAHVSQMWTQSRRQCAEQGKSRPDPYSVSAPIQLTGCWRPVFRRDESGCETRQFQFLAATWTYEGADGRTETHGLAPCI